MKKLSKRRLRDIKQNKMQFFNIFIMVFLGVFVFAGIHAYMDGMEESADKYYKDNNFQDIWLSGENFSNDDLEKVKNMENVKDAERILTIKTELENKNDVTLDTNFIESNNISKMYVVDGEEFSKDKKGVWFDSYLAKNLDLKVGDEITFTYQNMKMTEKILGLVNTPDHVYFVKDDTEIFPTHKNYGYMYLSINELPQGMLQIFNQIIVDVNKTDKMQETKANLENNIKSAIAVTDRESSVSYKGYNSEIEEGTTYSGVFTFLFLFIAVLSVTTTMNRFVKKQRTQIGTLKALGFKNRKIINHYVGYGFIISLVASVVGLLAGKYGLGTFFLNMEMSYFEVPVYNTVLIPVVYILAITVVALITLVTYLSCRNILKESAVEALRIEIPKVKSTKFDLTTKGIFKKASISTRWNLRDVGRNKGRSLMAIVGIIGCTMLMLCAFGMMDTMKSYLSWEFDKISNFEYKLSLSNNYTDDQFTNITEKYGNETSESFGIEIKNVDKKETNTLTVNDAPNKLKYTNHNKEYMDLKDDGIYITEKLSEKYGLKVGDEITWHIFGDDNWYTCKIAGLNRDPQNQQLNMTRKYYESLGLTYKADTVYTDENLINTKTIDGVDTIQSIATLKQGMESMLETTETMVVLLIVVSAILGFVIIYNLGILSFTE